MAACLLRRRRHYSGPPHVRRETPAAPAERFDGRTGRVRQPLFVLFAGGRHSLPALRRRSAKCAAHPSAAPWTRRAPGV